MDKLSRDALRELFSSQLEDWQQARDNYRALGGVKVKNYILDGFPVKVQFNPARIVSSAAKVDNKSISERKCFLCGENRPPVQQGLEFDGVSGTKYIVLINPFPIFPRHLTIPDIEHTRQQIKGRFSDMLKLALELPDYIVFYNGPKCGASAPDHMHFQAGSRGLLTIEKNLDKVNKFAKSAIVIKSNTIGAALEEFEEIYNVLPVKEGEWEPMLNILAWYEEMWKIVVFPRKSHRPSCFFAEGEDNILISPASVDLGGVFITPLEKDFNKINEEDIKKILEEIL
ncbi:MAG: DUF4922 domain-containing protein [Bacteroidales bacterium]|jgi:ATP adenylyltransferase/5',5'''-P-1,P-4-tetraphosphate phosphorylase II